MLNPLEAKKRYWSVSEMSNILNISESKIRFYEKEFDLDIIRKKRGVRVYREEDFEKFIFIIYLIDVEKFTIAGALTKFKQYKTLKNWKNIFKNAGNM